MQSRAVSLLVTLLAAGCGHRSRASHDAGPDSAIAPPDAPADLAVDAAPAPDAPADLPPPADVAADVSREAGIAGIATLIGQTNHEGTAVQIEGQAASATTGADGSFLLPLLPAGDYHLLL